jgi:hypothetical protein
MIIYNFIKSYFLHRKYNKILKKVYKDENLINNLSSLFNTKFRVDWVGRIYTVINPNIVDGKYDPNAQVFEYGNNGLNNDEYVKRQIMQKLIIAEQFITTNNLFDMLTYDIKKLDDNGNFLFIIQPITLEDCLNNLKKLSILVGTISIISIVCLIVWNNLH